MKIEKVIVVVFVSLVTAVTSGLIAQQGGMQMPPGMQGQMPTPEQIEEFMKQQMKMMETQIKATVDQEFPKFDDDEDGKLSADEFEELYKKMMVGVPGMQSGAEPESEEEIAEQMKKRFEEIDADDDDSLSKDEIAASIIKQMKADAGIEDSEEDEDETEDDDESNEEDADTDDEEEE